MEMQNSAINSVADMQTNILEEIRELRRRDEMRYNMDQLEKGATVAPITMDPAVISPVSGAAVNDVALMDQAARSVYQNDSARVTMASPAENYGGLPEIAPPTDLLSTATGFQDLKGAFSYDAISDYANFDPESVDLKGDLREVAVKQYDGIKNTATSLVQDFTGLDASRMSSDDIQKHFARRSIGVSNLSAEVGGAAIGLAGTAATFGLPILSGLGVGVAAGSVAKSFTAGAKESLGYQDILLEDGHKAFNVMESTGDYGSIGIGRDDRKELSKMVRHLAVDNFLDDEEMSDILQGSLDYKLLRSAQDIETFENKFKDIVKTTRKITTTLGTSIEEAQVMMAEFNKVGVDVNDMANLSAEGRLGASMVGAESGEFVERTVSVAQGLTAGTATDTGGVISGLNQSAMIVGQMEKYYEEHDEKSKQYLKNMGGAQGLSEDMYTRIFQATGSDEMMQGVLGLYGAAFDNVDGEFVLNEERLAEMAGGNYTPQELMKMSARTLREGNDAGQMMRMSQDMGNQLRESGDITQMSRMIEAVVQKMMEASPQMTEEQALMQLGVYDDSDYAGAKVGYDFIRGASIPGQQEQFKGLATLQELDAEERLGKPGLTKRLQYGWRSAFGLPIEDWGQGFSEGFGDINDKFSAFMQEKTEGVKTYDIDKVEGREEIERTSKERRDFIKEYKDEKGQSFRELEKPETDLELDQRSGRMNSGEYNALLAKAKSDKLTFAEQERLEQEREVAGHMRGQQIDQILDAAVGEDGFFKGMYTRAGTWFAKEETYNKTHSRGGVGDAAYLQDMKDDFSGQFKKARGDIGKQLRTSGLGGKEREILFEQLTQLDETGSYDEDAVKQAAKGNEDLLKNFEELRELSERLSEVGEYEEQYLTDAQSAQATLDLSADAYGLLKKAGVVDEDTYHSTYGKQQSKRRKQVKKDSKKLKDLKGEELGEITDYYKSYVDDMFASQSQEDLEKVAETMLDVSSSHTIEDFQVDGRFDSTKMTGAYFDIFGEAKTNNEKVYDMLVEEGESGEKKSWWQKSKEALFGAGEDSEAADELTKGSGDLTDAVRDHTDALAQSTEMIVGATKELQSQMADLELNKKKTLTSRMG